MSIHLYLDTSHFIRKFICGVHASIWAYVGLDQGVHVNIDSSACMNLHMKN